MMLYPKTRDDWLQLRKSYVSSTESSALFGLNKYTTAFELAMLKAGKVEDDFTGDERSMWGQLLERTIATHYAEENGVKIRALNAYATDPIDPIGASYDFEIIGQELRDTDAAALYRQHGPGVLEIKNVDRGIFREEWTNDEAPAHIEIQVQQQLECAEREWAIIAVLVGGNDLRSFVRLRDREVGAAIRRRAREFWRELQRGVYPSPVLPADIDVITRLYAKAEKGTVMDAQGNQEIGLLCDQYLEACEFEKRAQDQKATCKGMLLPLIGTHARVFSDAFTISCGEVGETVVPSYTRKAFRAFRVTRSKNREKDNGVKAVSGAGDREREGLRSGG